MSYGLREVSYGLRLPTPITAERHPAGHGVWVKHDELVHPDCPNGKLRGVLPLLARLQAEGARGVVNAGASHSNSHALVAHAAAMLGLEAVTVVNTSRPTPATDAAAAVGAEVVLTRPSHLQPLRAAARRVAEERGYPLLPWAFATAEVVDSISLAVDELADEWGTIIVPVGGGGYAAAIYEGVVRRGWRTTVVAVPALDGQDAARRRVWALLSLPPDERLWVTGRVRKLVPPWPCDARYEGPAWGMAGATWRHQPVLFWSVGKAMAS